MVNSEDEWKLLCVVRGYHACKDVYDSQDEAQPAHQVRSCVRLAIAQLQWALPWFPHRSLDRFLPTFCGCE